MCVEILEDTHAIGGAGGSRVDEFVSEFIVRFQVIELCFFSDLRESSAVEMIVRPAVSVAAVVEGFAVFLPQFLPIVFEDLYFFARDCVYLQFIFVFLLCFSSIVVFDCTVVEESLSCVRVVFNKECGGGCFIEITPACVCAICISVFDLCENFITSLDGSSM